MNKIERRIIAICVLCVILVLTYAIIVIKLDWGNMLQALILAIIVSVAVNILIVQKKEKKSLLIDGGSGNGCCETLFLVNGTQWRLPHIENVSFNDALRYEDNEWRLATLEDFSLLNKCAKYTKERNKRTINICIDEFSFYLEPRFWTGNVTLIGKNRAVAAAQYYPTGFQPFHGHLPDIDTEKRAGVILVKKEIHSPVKSYIEVLIKGDDIDTWNLKPGVCNKIRLGDKIAIERRRITEPDFMLGTFSDDTRNIFSQNENRYFGFSNILFIQITEKIYHESHVEFHGKVVPEDGLFYSNK